VACVRSAIGALYFADAFGLVGAAKERNSRRANPFAADWLKPDRRIDYIFVRGDERGRGEPIEASRLFHRPHRGRSRQRSLRRQCYAAHRGLNETIVPEGDVVRWAARCALWLARRRLRRKQ